MRRWIPVLLLLLIHTYQTCVCTVGIERLICWRQLPHMYGTAKPTTPNGFLVIIIKNLSQIAMISPGFNSCEHTLNTLRYADRYYHNACTLCLNHLQLYLHEHVKCVYRVKELSSNKGGGPGDGGVVFSAPPPLSKLK